MKKTYMKPSAEAVEIRQVRMLCGSTGAKSVKSDDGFSLSDSMSDDDV